MSKINKQFKVLCQSSAALARARTEHHANTHQLFATLSPILHKHKEIIGELFDAAGCGDIYQERFGSIYGNRVQSIGADEKNLTVTVVDYFRGEQEDYTFKLPRKYLNGDPAEQLSLDVAYYEATFARLALRRERQEAQECRSQNLEELARLTEIFKNDPEAQKSLGAFASPN